MSIGKLVASSLSESLHKSITAASDANSAVRAIHDHAGDGSGRARHRGVSAAVRTVVILHQPRVANSSVWGDGVVDADTALGFLHHDGEDEAGVHVGSLSDGLDGGIDVFDLIGGVVILLELSAGFAEDLLVVGEDGVVGCPAIFRWPSLADTSVTCEEGWSSGGGGCGAAGGGGWRGLGSTIGSTIDCSSR